MTVSLTKKCPACAEEIRSDALRCRHCGNLMVPAEWQEWVLSWRDLPEPERKKRWDAMPPEQQDLCRSVDAILPRSASHPQAPAPPSGTFLEGDAMVCPNPNCNYRGPSKKVPRGNAGLGCLLLVFFVVPGILYFMLTSGYRYVCPACGLQIRSDG